MLKKDIFKAARDAHVDKYVSKLEKGYETILSPTFEGGSDLSVGQWQRLAIARMFYRDAPILILDEPTSAIDAKAEADIFENIYKFSKDKTVIIVSHRFSTVKKADVIYVIDGGNIVESGSHSELMEKNGMYAEQFRVQSKGYEE